MEALGPLRRSILVPCDGVLMITSKGPFLLNAVTITRACVISIVARFASFGAPNDFLHTFNIIETIFLHVQFCRVDEHTLNAREASFGAIMGHAQFAKMTSPPTWSFYFRLLSFLNCLKRRLKEPSACLLNRACRCLPHANNESTEVIDILLPVTFYFNPSTRLDNVENL